MLVKNTIYGSDTGNAWGIQVYDDNMNYLAHKYIYWDNSNTDWHKDILEGYPIVSGGTQARIRIYVDKNTIGKFREPMVNIGDSIINFENGTHNKIKNPIFADGLNGWYSNYDKNTGGVPLNKFYSFIDTENYSYHYIVENNSSVKGTFPDGILANSISGSEIFIYGSSENGIGGTTQRWNIAGKLYERKYTYEWSEWKITQGVYGSFDSAGAWHNLDGDIVDKGIVYNISDGNYYALAKDGKVYTTTGFHTLPLGRDHDDLSKNLNINILSGGIVDTDISKNPVSQKYVETVNEYIEKNSSKASINIVVSDTHGATKRDIFKAHNILLSGNQYKTNYFDNIYASQKFLSKNNYDNLDGTYYRTIARINAKTGPSNILKIAKKFNKPYNVLSHLGDVNDGTNFTPNEEREAYDIVSNPYRDAGFNMVDGNHDLQPYPYEIEMLTNIDNIKIAPVVPNANRSRRIDTDRFIESYGNSLGYSYKDDLENKVRYIYLNTFESGKLKRKDGTTPPFGDYRKGGMITKKQIEWLVSVLENTGDDTSVVINTHIIPNDDIIGKAPVTSGEGTSWWNKDHVNDNLLAGLLIAFQESSIYDGQSEFESEFKELFDTEPYSASISVDFTKNNKGRIAAINYGHYHTYGHTSKEENGHFNVIQYPNLLGPGWGYIGDPRGQQFATQIIDTEYRKVHVIRFSPNTDNVDSEFTLDY